MLLLPLDAKTNPANPTDNKWEFLNLHHKARSISKLLQLIDPLLTK